MLEFVCSYGLLYRGSFFSIEGELVSVVYCTAGRVCTVHMSHIDDYASVYKAKIGIFQKRLTEYRKGTTAFSRFGTVDYAVVGV